MQHALEITEYFRATALKVHKHIKRGDKEVSKAAIIKKLSDLGHSQKAIAKMLDVSQPYVSKIIKD
ncbi:helix-turn-helix domain-containing protein [Bacteroidia bacterium]|nr:helix-turn-helix domain-containing protein [Bacteroidia bacterium]